MCFTLVNIQILLLFFLAATFSRSSSAGSPEVVNYSILEDGALPLPALVEKYGYPVETHITYTADGYELTLYRIPGSTKCNSTKAKKPVLLQHGLLCSAYDFLTMGPKKSLGYLLADNCYDVWLGNNRGNSQSRNHKNLTIKHSDFWKFTWHEMGEYDIPAMIDLILNVTQQKKLHYIGHSQGTTQFFVFGSLHPEYHEKIESMQALSPVVYMKHLASPLVRVLMIFYDITEALTELIGLHEFLPASEFLNTLGRSLCQDKSPRFQKICANILFLLCGFDELQLNATLLPAILGHVPAGASTKQFSHYAQNIKSGEFRHFDFGADLNLQKYGSVSPPKYNLKDIDIPIAIYYGPNDWLADMKDVNSLKQELPNVILDHRIPFSKFNHLDFLYAIDAKFLVYDKLLEVLEKFG